MLQYLTPESRYETVGPRMQTFHQVSVTTENPAVALAAQWAADVTALEQHLWQTSIVASPDYDLEFSKINDFIAEALTAFTGTEPTATASEALESIHAVVSDIFADHSTGTRWRDKCLPAHHLEGMPSPTAQDWTDLTDRHTAGLPVEQVLADRQHDTAVLAGRILTTPPSPGDAAALEVVWEHDWTAFHAHLLQASINAGDVHLIGVEMRWQGAALTAAAIASIPGHPRDAVAAWRPAFEHVLGPVEGPAFISTLIGV